jgi:hypothetical protein
VILVKQDQPYRNAHVGGLGVPLWKHPPEAEYPLPPLRDTHVRNSYALPLCCCVVFTSEKGYVEAEAQLGNDTAPNDDPWPKPNVAFERRLICMEKAFAKLYHT